MKRTTSKKKLLKCVRRKKETGKMKMGEKNRAGNKK